MLKSPAEGALSVVAGALRPQAISCFGRYMDGEAGEGLYGLERFVHV